MYERIDFPIKEMNEGGLVVPGVHLILHLTSAKHSAKITFIIMYSPTNFFFFTPTPFLFFFALAAQAAPAPPSSPNSTAIPSSSSSSPGHGTLTTTHLTPHIIRATINNPPINLWDYKLASDFSSFLDGLAANTNTNTTSNPKVVILSSANPDFFLSHYDIRALSRTYPVPPPGNATLFGQQLLRSRTLLATLPVVFIAEINGRASGAGDEVLLQCDIRYAGPSTRLSQFEVGFGVPPGAGGVQFLVKLIGRARALEYMLSGRGVDAGTAASVGWVNRAFGSEGELRREVEGLAGRIAAFPAQGLAAIKARVNVQRPSEGDLEGDNEVFVRLTGTEVSEKAADRFLVLGGDQSAGGFELGVPDDVVEIVS